MATTSYSDYVERAGQAAQRFPGVIGNFLGSLGNSIGTWHAQNIGAPIARTFSGDNNNSAILQHILADSLQGPLPWPSMDGIVAGAIKRRRQTPSSAASELPTRGPLWGPGLTPYNPSYTPKTQQPAKEPPLPEIPSFDFGPLPDVGFDVSPYGKNVKDFLGDSRELYQDALDAALNDIKGRRKDLKRQGKESDSVLKQIFSDYVANTEARAPEISQRYDDASGVARTQADEAAAASQEAYNQALEQQAAIRRALGLEDVDLRDAETQQADIMQQAVADANERALTQQALMGENKQAQLDWNEAVASSAGAEGTSQRAQVQSDLLSHLAALQDQQTLTEAEYENRILGSAFDLFNMDYGQWRDQRDMAAQNAQMAYSRMLADRDFQYRQFNDQRDYELGLTDRAIDQQRYETQLGLDQLANQPEFDINKERLDAQMQYYMQQSGFSPQEVNTAIDAFQRSIMQGGGDRDKTRFVNNVQRELQRMGWDENRIRSAIFRASEYWDAYSGR